MSATATEPAAQWAAWRQAVATEPDLVAAVDGVHRAAEAETARHEGRCDQSGRCCRFESHGHRLYVTGLEAALFLSRVDAGAERGPGGDAIRRLPVLQIGTNAMGPRYADACPYQIDGLCSTHRIRPLGCRVYFCGGEGDGWQEAIYERATERLRALHTAHGLPYRYAEWRALLAEGGG